MFHLFGRVQEVFLVLIAILKSVHELCAGNFTNLMILYCEKFAFCFEICINYVHIVRPFCTPFSVPFARFLPTGLHSCRTRLAPVCHR